MSTEDLNLTLQQVKKTYAKRKRPTRPDQNQEEARERRSKRNQEDIREPDKVAAPNTVEEEMNEMDDAALKTRMSPIEFRRLLKSLTPEQKQAVEDINFGSLLQFQIPSWDNRLCAYLVQNFDVYRCALKLEDEEMLLTEEDVESTLGLPRGEVEVVEGNNSNATEEYNKLLDNWRARWHMTSCSPLVKVLSKGIVDMGEHGDMFKRDFVVFVVSSLFKGHANRTTHFRLLYSLLDVNNIKNLNWCGYILKSLVESVEKWKKKPSTFFTGPLVFLVVSYLDRLQFKGQRIQRKYPAILTWTEDMVQKRYAVEKQSGGYGRGKVLDRVTRSAVEVEKENVGEEKVAAEEKEGSVGEKATMSDAEKISNAITKIAVAVHEFGQVMAEVGSKNIGKEIVKKTFNKMSDMLNMASTSQPAESPSLLDDDPIFNDEKFLAAVAALEEAVTKTTDCPVSSPNWNLLTPTPPDVQKTPQPPTTKTFETATTTATPQAQATTTTTLPAQDIAPKEKSLLDRVIEESESDVEDVQYRRKTHRTFKNLPLSLRSPYWTTYNAKLNNVSQKEKLLSDFAFMDPSVQHPNEEMLFQFKKFNIARDQFLTLRSGYIEKSIIDVWTVRMNLKNMTRSMGAAKCVYFSTDAVMQVDDSVRWRKELPPETKQRHFNEVLDYELELASNLDISDAELVFFAVLRHDHFFIMCLNFKNKLLQVIDNKCLGKGVNFGNKYENCDRILVESFKSYLKFKRITSMLNRMTEEGAFQSELVKMSWKNSTNVTDCGIYCMRHLETYKGCGPNWTSGFNRSKENALFLTSLRAKYAANILYLPINEKREYVLEQARTMYGSK